MKTLKRKARRPESRHDGISTRLVSELKPSPENDKLYRPIDPKSPEIRALAASVKKLKIKEPLVITLDDYVVSGHRRLVAAKLAGLKEVPCRIEPIRRLDDIDAFVRLLAVYNKQRVKAFDELLRETLVDIDPNEAYTNLITQRAERTPFIVESIELNGTKQRATITSAKEPMLQAIKTVIEERRSFWPLSDRQIHYALLNSPPRRHASKPGSKYRNDRKSYQDLCDLLTRGRLAGAIPFQAIADETRPIQVWDVHREPSTFLKREFDGLLTGYWRDLMHSQPNHVEVVVEKNTVSSICQPVCAKYTIPMTSGRGFCSLPPRHDMAKRYRQSGAGKLILLVVSDHDPEGMAIAESFARSMRDDFRIRHVQAIKVALTAEQVREYDLPPEMTAKSGSSNRKKFVDLHGEHVWELEALQPDDLQRILDEAIKSVIDLEAFNHEVEAERADAGKIEAVRRTITENLKDIDFNAEGGI